MVKCSKISAFYSMISWQISVSFCFPYFSIKRYMKGTQQKLNGHFFYIIHFFFFFFFDTMSVLPPNLAIIKDPVYKVYSKVPYLT